MEFPREETSVMDANYASIRKPAEIMFIPSNMGKAKNRRYYQVRWGGECLGETRETRLVIEVQMECGLDAARCGVPSTSSILSFRLLGQS